MGTKREPGAYDCYKKALPDEPMFVLLARDICAPQVIEHWADLREGAIARGTCPEQDMEMIDEARRCAKEMRRWRTYNYGSWRWTRLRRWWQRRVRGRPSDDPRQ